MQGREYTVGLILAIIILGAGIFTIFQVFPTNQGPEEEKVMISDPGISIGFSSPPTRNGEGKEIYRDEFGNIIDWYYADISNINSSVRSDGSHCVVEDFGDNTGGYWGPIIEKELPEIISVDDDFILDVRYYAKPDHLDYGIRIRVDMMDDQNNSIAWLEYKDTRGTIGEGKTYLNAEDQRIHEFEDPSFLYVPDNYDRKLSIARQNTSWHAYVGGGRASGLTLEPHFNCSKVRLSMQKCHYFFARDPKVDYIIIKKGDLHPETPKGFNVTVDPWEREVKLKWDQIQGSIHDGYRVYRTQGTSTVKVADVFRDQKTASDSGMAKGINYSYSVCAYNTYTESNRSAPIVVNITTVPSEEMNLSAVKMEERIELQWQPPDDDGGVPILNYTLYRKNGTDPANILNQYPPGNSNYGYIDHNITLGEMYTYFVTATNDLGESKMGEGLEILFLFTPEMPKNLAAVYGDNCVNLSWEPPEYTGGGEIIRYRIYRNITDIGSEEFLVNVSGTETQYKDLNIKVNGTYKYRVTAVNGLEESGFSQTATVSVTIIFKAPGSPTGLRVIFEDEIVKVSWGRPIFTGGLYIQEYMIYRGEEPGNRSYLASVAGNVTEYEDLSLINNRTYYYSVSAVNDVGESEQSEERSVKVLLEVFYPPGSPDNVEAEFVTNIVQISWEPPTYLGGTPILEYNIYRSENGGSFLLLGNTSYLIFTYADTDLINDTTYVYRITAVNHKGESEPSGELEIHVILPEEPADDDTTDDDTGDDDDTSDKGLYILITVLIVVLLIVLVIAAIVIFALVNRRKDSDEE